MFVGLVWDLLSTSEDRSVYVYPNDIDPGNGVIRELAELATAQQGDLLDESERKRSSCRKLTT
jgi:hypothetical protein